MGKQKELNKIFAYLDEKVQIGIVHDWYPFTESTKGRKLVVSITQPLWEKLLWPALQQLTDAVMIIEAIDDFEGRKLYTLKLNWNDAKKTEE